MHHARKTSVKDNLSDVVQVRKIQKQIFLFSFDPKIKQINLSTFGPKTTLGQKVGANFVPFLGELNTQKKCPSEFFWPLKRCLNTSDPVILNLLADELEPKRPKKKLENLEYFNLLAKGIYIRFALIFQILIFVFTF